MKKLNELTKHEFDALKNSGYLWEIFPDAPESYHEILNKDVEVKAFDENFKPITLNYGDEFHVVDASTLQYLGHGVLQSSEFSENSLLFVSKEAAIKFIDYVQPTYSKEQLTIFIEKYLYTVYDKKIVKQMINFFEL